VLEETERFMTRVGMRTIFRGSKPPTPVMGQPAEQVPQAMHRSVELWIGLRGAFAFISDGILSITDEMIGLPSDTELRMSWITVNLHDTSIDDPLFYITFTSTKSGYLSELLTLKTDKLQAEVYIGENLDVVPLELQVRNGQLKTGQFRSVRIHECAVEHDRAETDLHCIPARVCGQGTDVAGSYLVAGCAR